MFFIFALGERKNEKRIKAGLHTLLSQAWRMIAPKRLIKSVED
jgi:hypothetical protein